MTIFFVLTCDPRSIMMDRYISLRMYMRSMSSTCEHACKALQNVSLVYTQKKTGEKKRKKSEHPTVSTNKYLRGSERPFTPPPSLAPRRLKKKLATVNGTAYQPSVLKVMIVSLGGLYVAVMSYYKCNLKLVSSSPQAAWPSQNAGAHRPVAVM